MKKYIILAAMAAFPALAQDVAPAPLVCSGHPAPQVCPLPPESPEAIQAKANHHAAHQARMMERMTARFDSNKDGQLDQAEKAAAFDAMSKGHRGHKHAAKGHKRNHGCMSQKQHVKAMMLKKFDANKDGKLDATEKEALKAARALRGAKGAKACGKPVAPAPAPAPAPQA